jgi:hypothetical protein
MRKTREILRLKWQQGRSHREIARNLALGVGTPSEVAKRAREAGLASWEVVDAFSEEELDGGRCALLKAGAVEGIGHARRLRGSILIPRGSISSCDDTATRRGCCTRSTCRRSPEATGIRDTSPLQRVGGAAQGRHAPRSTTPGGMLRRLFWQEAIDRCPDDGERIKVELFVAVMGASNFSYAEMTATQQSADWIGGQRRPDGGCHSGGQCGDRNQRRPDEQRGGRLRRSLRVPVAPVVSRRCRGIARRQKGATAR